MTAEERLALVRVKIKRSDKHIEDLKAAVDTFINSGPYKADTKRDPNTRKLIYYVSSAQPVPVCIAAIAGDALHCLRDALDHLAQQLYQVGTGVSGYGDRVEFPIGMNAKKFRDGLRKKVKGVRQDAIDAICALEPYGGGKGNDLWTLHRLNNIDKHRAIPTVGTAFRSMDIAPILAAHYEKAFGKSLPIPELFMRPDDNLFPLEVGKELFIDLPDEEPIEKIRFRYDVAVHESGIIEGKPIFETLVQFRDRIDKIIESFKPYLA
jgi:hypothetical protein